MPKSDVHKWAFAPRFRRHAFGWRSQPAIQRVKEAVAEIKKTANNDPALAASGAVLFLEKLSPALERVDSSSGAIGTAVNHAIEALVTIVANAPANDATRDQWLDRLWQAHQDDAIPYIERLGDYWGELCGSKEQAAVWADRLVGIVEISWSPDPQRRGFFHGTTACLSAMLRAERYDQILTLLDKATYPMWQYRQWGVKALVGMGRKADAIHYAETNRGLNDSSIAIARACEEILLSSGLAEEAYARYAIQANQAISFLATFRAIVKKYPKKSPSTVLHDLVESTPGQEGKWFAAAKDAGLYDEAIALATRTPCDPRTLTRAARDFVTQNPAFAIEAGLAALRWIVAGYGYEITSLDVSAAYSSTMAAARNAEAVEQTRQRLRETLRAVDSPRQAFVARILERDLNPS